ncbi:MAG: hypothetical protein ABSA46_13705 [Thermodesulfovibrionales bacterium]
MEYNETEDWHQFRSMYTLPIRAGVSRDKIGKLVAKETVDNGLDSGGQCRIGYLREGFFVEDDSTGIDGTDEDIASLYSMRRGLRTTKMWRLPKRGALGNGLRVLAGAVCATNGTLLVSTRGRSLRLTPEYDDGITKHESLGPWCGKRTRVEVTLPGLDEKSMLSWAEETILMSNGKDFDGCTSPWWYCSESFRALVDSSPCSLVLSDFVKKFGVQEDKKALRLAFRFSNKKLKELTETECEELLSELRRLQKPVKPKVLLEYGAVLHDSNHSYYEGSSTYIIKPVRGRHEAHIPFAVQVWGEKCSAEDDLSVKFFVNKTVIAGNASITVWNMQNNKKNSKEEKYFCLEGCGLEKGNVIQISRIAFPVNLIISIITPHMQITSSGKEPDFSYMRDVIKDVIEKVVIETKKKNKVDKNNEDGPKVTIVSVVRKRIDDLIKKVSDNLSHRYNPRHLYYPMRDIVNEELPGTVLNWKYFELMVTDIESENESDLPGIYRDLRGTLYHPHLKEDIPLGTLNVERYKRPDWTFNKILYIEKEGFFEILKDLEWPERNDCALLTSKGFATRAARDVIDLLGDTDEEIMFFCVHDADAYGTLIYQCLVRATKARPARRVKVHNLGLEPWEALMMGLRVEDAEKTKDRKPVAEYAKYIEIYDEEDIEESVDQKVWNEWLTFLREQGRNLNREQWNEWLSECKIEYVGNGVDWEKWLQSNRIELNAITILNFMRWLDEKMLRYGPGKVLPPEEIIRNEIREVAKEKFSARIREQLNRKFNIEGLVAQELNKRLARIEREINSMNHIREDIRKSLQKNATRTWKIFVNKIVSGILAKLR